MPHYTYQHYDTLFTRKTLIRRGEITQYHVAVYDRFGEYIDTYKSITEAQENTGLSKPTIAAALKSGKQSKGYAFRYVPVDENAAAEIVVPCICYIDGIPFFKQQEIADYCGVSQQAVSGSIQRKSKQIGGREIEWFIAE